MLSIELLYTYSFSGSHCETNINECSSRPCQNGAICHDAINGYACECVTGYAGRHCGIDIDECASDPCQNGGNCTDGINGYKCTCVPGYAGGYD